MFERTNSPRDLSVQCTECSHVNRLSGGGLHASDPVHCAKCRKYLGTLLEIQFEGAKAVKPVG